MATIVAWNDTYSVGIHEIDEQHQILVELINKLYTALARRASNGIVEGVLAELVRYTRVHFATEECLMRVFGYPGYEEHKVAHDRLVARVELFLTDFRERGPKGGLDLLYFLREWLMRHINEEDKAYSPHVAREGRRGWSRPFG